MGTSRWLVKPTGNMTLAVETEGGQQVLAADLLSTGDLRAGDDAEALARLWNSLGLLASIPARLAGEQLEDALLFPESGLRPFPWRIAHNPGRHHLVVRDGQGRKIAERRFPARMQGPWEAAIVRALSEGVVLLREAFP